MLGNDVNQPKMFFTIPVGINLSHEIMTSQISQEKLFYNQQHPRRKS